MITGRSRFNIYLLLAVAVVLMCGCRTGGDGKTKKQFATLRIHAEAPPRQPGFTTSVPISRTEPTKLTVGTSPVLTELHLSSARVIDTPAGFELELKFDRQGMLLLEESTGSNPGRRLAIFCYFGEAGWEEGRWLAAPIVRRRISNGIFSFTPDATRDEAEQIATSLNNTVQQNTGKYRW
jgi:preprotein translocase subunit SecD